MSWLEDIVQHHSLARIGVSGASVVVAALLGTVWATGWGDVALVGAAGVAAIGTAVAARTRQQLLELPLELAEVAATSVVDGRRCVRFRVRLGHGRCFRPVRVDVQFVPEGEPPRPVEVHVPEGLVCGPLTLVVTAPEGSGHFVVDVAAEEAGRPWASSRTYGASALQAGRFAEGILTGPVRFGPGWDRVA